MTITIEPEEVRQVCFCFVSLGILVLIGIALFQLYAIKQAEMEHQHGIDRDNF